MAEAKTKQMQKTYLDTFIFMDVLSGSELAEKAAAYLRQGGVVSAVLLEELAFHVARRRGKEKAEEVLSFVQSLPLDFVPVTAEIAVLAGKLRAKYHKKIAKHLTYFDCVHLATALAMQCEKFVTGDRGFRDIEEIEMEIY